MVMDCIAMHVFPNHSCFIKRSRQMYCVADGGVLMVEEIKNNCVCGFYLLSA